MPSANTATILEFSRHSRDYDALSWVQTQAFNALISQGPEHADSILDIGCGTGRLTVKLAERYRKASILGIDAAPDMIARAKDRYATPQISYHCADILSQSPSGAFDLIFSNSTFQWLDPLNRLTRCLHTIKGPSTQLLGSAFGPQSFPEFRQVLADVMGRRVPLRCDHFATKSAYQTALQTVFASVAISSKTYTQSFDTLSELLATLTATGGQALGRRFSAPSFQAALTAAYRHRFSNIQLSAKVFFIRAG